MRYNKLLISYIIYVSLSIPVQGDLDTILEKYNIDIDAKSTKGWIRLFNSDRVKYLNIPNEDIIYIKKELRIKLKNEKNMVSGEMK